MDRREYQREYSRKNSAKKVAAVREWRKKNKRTDKRTPEADRRARLKYRYGITVEQYDEMLTSQGGVCAVCGLPPVEKPLNVDHDHGTGKVRGLLHGDCNRALGLLRDNPDFMRRAAEYVELSRR